MQKKRKTYRMARFVSPFEILRNPGNSKHARSSNRVVVALALCVFLAACSQTSKSSFDEDQAYLLGEGATDITLDHVHKVPVARDLNDLADITADGTITRAEFERSHKRMVECVIVAGLYTVIGETYVDPLDASMILTDLEPVFDDLSESQVQVLRACNMAYIPVEDLVVQNTKPEERVVASDLYAYLHQCLSELGWEVDESGKTLAQLVNGVPQANADPEQVMDCATAGIKELYPHVGTIRVGF